MRDILEHIEKVKMYMLRDNIKANTILIDSEVARVNGFRCFLDNRTMADVPTMFMGLQVFYKENLSEKVGTPANFIIAERKIHKQKTPLSEYSTKELLDEIRKRLN